MTKNEFLDEVHLFITEQYSHFAEYQRITLDILKYVNALFKQERIEYYLAYGTLLGAVRDKSPIPWDYDVDIYVKISELSHLLNVLDNNLGDEYYYTFTNNMSNYPAPCLRICRKGYTFMAFHVDVFFLIGTSDDPKNRIKHIKQIKKWANIRVNKYISKYIPCESKSKLRLLYDRISHLKYIFYPEVLLKYKEYRLMNMYSVYSSNLFAVYCCGINYGSKEKEIYPASIFSEIEEIEYYGELYSIPSGFDKYLSIAYNNPYSYLPIKQRFDEFYNMMDIISSRQDFYLKLNK